MRLSCSSAGRVARCPETILVNSRLNSRAEIFFFLDFFLSFLAKTVSEYFSIPQSNDITRLDSAQRTAL
jgi:hypothetical protein